MYFPSSGHDPNKCCILRRLHYISAFPLVRICDGIVVEMVLIRPVQRSTHIAVVSAAWFVLSLIQGATDFGIKRCRQILTQTYHWPTVLPGNMTSVGETHPFPDIEDRQKRDNIFIHGSLKSLEELPSDDAEEDDYSNERLAYLGSTMIMAMITDIVFRGMHGVSRKELDRRRTFFIRKSSIVWWSDAYGLVKAVRAAGHQQSSLAYSENIKIQLFQAYFGLVYLQNGFVPTRNWLEKLMDLTENDLPPEPDVDGAADALGATSLGDRPSPRTTPPASPVQQPGRPPKDPVQAFHEKCARRKYAWGWKESNQGPSHEPKFTVAIEVEGHPEIVGVGTARAKKAAQKLAAQMALDGPAW